MSDLLPCPFCSCKVDIIDVNGDNYTTDHSYMAYCRDCRVSTPYMKTYENVEKLWNTRADTPSISIWRELNKCQKAFNELYDKKVKLLAFVKKVSLNDVDYLEDCTYDYLDELEFESKTLLKEIGEG